MTTPITAVQTFTNPRKSVWLLDNLKEKKIFKWRTPSKSKFNKSDVKNDIQGIELEGHVLHERMKSTGVCTSAVTWHPGGRRKVCPDQQHPEQEGYWMGRDIWASAKTAARNRDRCRQCIRVLCVSWHVKDTRKMIDVGNAMEVICSLL